MFPASSMHSLPEMPHYRVAVTINISSLPRLQAGLYFCAICDDRISQWMGPNDWPAEKCSAPVHIKICWQPTWGLHYVHLAALGFHRPLSIQHCGIVQRWSLHCVDRSTNESWHWEYREAYFTSHTHTEKCAEVVEMFISGNQTYFPLEL